jgi:mRNA interferase HigB
LEALKNSVSKNFLLKKFCNSNLLYIFATHNKSIMRIVSHRKLKEFYETIERGDSRVALQRWYEIAEKAEWKHLADIKTDFSAVDYVGNQHYIFNIKGNNYRLVVIIKFVMGYIFIRFVGTHDEYDKIDCSTI